MKVGVQLKVKQGLELQLIMVKMVLAQTDCDVGDFKKVLEAKASQIC